MKLGKKKPPCCDIRTLQFRKYVNRINMPPLFINERWGQNVSDWTMLGNDMINNCPIATIGHTIMQWTSDALGMSLALSDEDIVCAYKALTALENNGHGYDPETGENDNGCYMLNALNYWRIRGIGGYKCDGYVQLEPGNVQHAQEAIHLFKSINVGLNLPLTAQNQFLANTYWSVMPYGPIGDAEPGTWGGMSATLLGYDQDGFTCIIWGKPYHLTYNFYKIYCDEAYAPVSFDWGGELIGFDVESMKKDLDCIKPHRDIWGQLFDWISKI